MVEGISSSVDFGQVTEQAEKARVLAPGESGDEFFCQYGRGLGLVAV